MPKVYVDQDGDLRTESGEYLREATQSEVDESRTTSEGYIAVPLDIEDYVEINDDGLTVPVRCGHCAAPAYTCGCENK